MRIRIKLDGYLTIIDTFFAEYDEDVYGVYFYTLDNDDICVMMSLIDWSVNSGLLLENGYVDLIKYPAELYPKV